MGVPMSTTALLIETIGWSGAALVLIGYLLLSLGRLSATSATFQWLNVLGAAGCVVNTWWHGAFPSLILNLFWTGIGLSALWRLWRDRENRLRQSGMVPSDR
jgi:hypothetical protein